MGVVCRAISMYDLSVVHLVLLGHLALSQPVLVIFALMPTTMKAMLWNAICLGGLIILMSSSSAQAQEKRLNKIVALLDAGMPVFGIFSGDKTPESAMDVVTTEADFIFYSMERGPFDVPGMQVYMQFMLERADLVDRKSLFNEHPILTRIPPIRDGRVEAQDRTQRILDAGVHGVVYPHIESAEDAEHAVRSMRYRPKGLRPTGRSVAARYWGVDREEYVARADIWPANPGGELINMLLIEDKIGIENARAIVSTEGVSIVIPGPGDLRRAYEGDDVAIENAIQTVLAACKEFDVACGITAGPDDIETRLEQGFRVFIVTSREAIAVGRRASAR